MMNILNKFFDSNEKEVDRLQPLLQKINSLDAEVKKYKEKDFAQKTREYRDRVAAGGGHPRRPRGQSQTDQSVIGHLRPRS